MLNLNTKNENIREKENMDKQTEYRNFLLKQISDKEIKKNQKTDESGMTSAFNEELIDPVE